jgi:hypothetical protein
MQQISHRTLEIFSSPERYAETKSVFHPQQSPRSSLPFISPHILNVLSLYENRRVCREESMLTPVSSYTAMPLFS